MLTLHKMNNICEVYLDGRCIGEVCLYDNPHHMRNCYIKLELERLDAEIGAELFKKLRKMAGRTLQIMADSDRAELVDFLCAGGFVCRRKCYEVEAGREDYIGGQMALPLACSRIGEPDYEKVCRMLFVKRTGG